MVYFVMANKYFIFAQMQPNAACDVLHTQTSKRASRLKAGKSTSRQKQNEQAKWRKQGILYIHSELCIKFVSLKQKLKTYFSLT